ncbi:hypothetical protein ABZP36_029175 [Zizania latifolia]
MATNIWETIPDELWWEILLRAPTRYVARSCCVSKLWCSIVRDPSFRKLHSDRHAAAPNENDVPDALLVATNDVGRYSIFPIVPAALVSPTAASTRESPVCRVTNAEGYSLANVCNGLLCFASRGAPTVVVCNPVTGERLAPSSDPPLLPDLHQQVTFALGFSPTTSEYKLFRFADRMIDVYTLAGETSGWRRHQLLHPCRLVKNHHSPPVVVGGKICAVAAAPPHPQQIERPGAVLVVDVASEVAFTYSTPDYGYPFADATASAFELHGRLCLAINVVNRVQFWAMPVEEEDDDLPWELLYQFRVNEDDIIVGLYHHSHKGARRSAWLDGETHTLCYRVGDRLYCRYVGTATPTTKSPDEVMSWDRKIHLPMAPLSPPAPQWLLSPPFKWSWRPSKSSWDIYGAYRPSFLSLLTIASLQPDDDDGDGVLSPPITMEPLQPDNDEGNENGRFMRSLLHHYLEPGQEVVAQHLRTFVRGELDDPDHNDEADSRYLVESRGELLMVVRIVPCPGDRTTSLRVFQMAPLPEPVVHIEYV